MELFFKALAVILAGVAAFFLWQGNKDGGYAAAVLGAVAFFLSVRFQVKKRNETREAEEEARWIAEEQERDAENDEADDVSENETAAANRRLNEMTAGERFGGSSDVLGGSSRAAEEAPRRAGDERRL